MDEPKPTMTYLEGFEYCKKHGITIKQYAQDIMGKNYQYIRDRLYYKVKFTEKWAKRLLTPTMYDNLINFKNPKTEFNLFHQTRDKLGLTNEDIAQKVGLKPKQVQFIMQNKGNFYASKLQNVLDICNVLGLSITTVIDFINTVEKDKNNVPKTRTRNKNTTQPDSDNANNLPNETPQSNHNPQ